MEEVITNEATKTETVKFNKVPSIIMIIVSVFVGGIIGIGLSVASLAIGSGVENLVALGKIEEAKKKISTAKIFLIISYVWDGLIGLILLFCIFGIIAGALASM